MFPCCVNIHGIASIHVESVVLLSRKNPDDYLEITWTAHDFGNKGFKPTYERFSLYNI